MENRTNAAYLQTLSRNRFLILLVFILLTLVLTPFLDEFIQTRILMDILLTFIYFAMIFAIGSSLASIGATLNALDIGTVDPGVGLHALLVCFVALVVGGMENIPGAAVGGFIVGMIYHLSIWRIEAKWQQVIVFLVLLAVLLVKPEGLFKRKKGKI